jgi:serine/threonine-protein kinase
MKRDIEPGNLLGRYIVEERIGEGGMGAVYKIRDPKSKMPYAAKVLHPALRREGGFARRFKREAKIARRLSHMNVVHVFGLKRLKGTLSYIMEFVEGAPLEEMLKNHGSISLERAIEIIRETAAGLHYIHTKRVVHRDIKPGNLLIRSDGHLKITDFGLAQKIGRARRTKSGHIMGTAKYMAPELIEGTYAYPQTDVYALGCLAYEMIAGRPPFEADHSEVFMDLHLYARQKPLIDVKKGIDRNLSLFVDKMLEKSMSKRVPSARMVHSWTDFYLTNGFFPELPKEFRFDDRGFRRVGGG